MFAVRITRTFDELKPFFVKFAAHKDSLCLVYQHDADEDVSRTHCHAMLTGTVASTDTLKRWVKDVVGPVEKHDWSFTRCREEAKYVTYMSKGKLDPVFCQGIDAEKVAALRAEWKEPQAVARSKSKGEDVTSYTMAEELAQWINSQDKEIYDKQLGMIVNLMNRIEMRDMILQCIKIHNKYRKGYCDFSLVRVIQTAQGLCNCERWKEQLVSKVVEKLSLRINV